MLEMLLPLSFSGKLEDRFLLSCLIVLYQFMNDYSVTRAEQSHAFKKSCF